MKIPLAEDIPRQMTDKLYCLPMKCANCGFDGLCYFDKGTEIKDYGCPECHTKNLVKRI